MIDFRDVWLPQILAYAGLIAEEDVLRRAWLKGETTETSVTSPDELIEQVFDDLDSEELVKEAPRHLASTSGLVGALEAFLTTMLEWEAEWDPQNVSPPAEESLFGQVGWARLRRQAHRLRTEAKAAGIEADLA